MTKFCQNCGSLLPEDAVRCPHCGLQGIVSRDPITDSLSPNVGRSWVVTLLLAVLFPLFGVHRMYTGDVFLGFLQLLTLGGCGIWWLVDVMMILIGSYRDAEGRELVK